MLADKVFSLDQIIMHRHSVRAFLPTPVPRALLEQVLCVASHAPSSANIQPWRVYVITGAAQQRLKTDLYKAYLDPLQREQHTAELKYYPEEWFSPYKERRKEIGLALYQTLGIKKTDHESMTVQQARNMLFFDAPVSLIFSCDNRLAAGSQVDCGMFIQTVMLAAQARNLGTCAQASINQFHSIVRKHCAIAEHETLICGMSLGYEDTDHPANKVKSTRAPLDDFVQWVEDQ